MTHRKTGPVVSPARWLCAAPLALAVLTTPQAAPQPDGKAPPTKAAPARSPAAEAPPPFEGPWEDFPRTYPTPRYEQDPGHKADYAFGVNKAFPPYQDPDIAAATSLPSPLLNPAFDSYNLIVVVNKAKDAYWGAPQTLRVYKRGQGLIYYWLVSTGMKGFDTPSGYYTPQAFSSRHWSSKWDAPMLWAVFFNHGQALHSSLDRFSLSQLGRATDSHGCVHVEDYRAEELFHLVGQSGYGPVDRLDQSSGKPTGGKMQSYRTLIIVAPVSGWGKSNRQAGQIPTNQSSTAPAPAPSTVPAKSGRGARHTLKLPGRSNMPTPEQLF